MSFFFWEGGGGGGLGGTTQMMSFPGCRISMVPEDPEDVELCVEGSGWRGLGQRKAFGLRVAHGVRLESFKGPATAKGFGEDVIGPGRLYHDQHRPPYEKAWMSL